MAGLNPGRPAARRPALRRPALWRPLVLACAGLYFLVPLAASVIFTVDVPGEGVTFDAYTRILGTDGFVSSLEFFEHIGMRPAEIIDLATAGAAEALGIAHDTGRLAPGHRADLLVVEGDPLTDLSALRTVRLVLAEGRPFGPETVRSIPPDGRDR